MPKWWSLRGRPRDPQGTALSGRRYGQGCQARCKLIGRAFASLRHLDSGGANHGRILSPNVTVALSHDPTEQSIFTLDNFKRILSILDRYREVAQRVEDPSSTQRNLKSKAHGHSYSHSPNMSGLQAIRYSRGKLEVLDQLRLPHEHHYDLVSTSEEAFDCIKSMRVRGMIMQTLVSYPVMSFIPSD